VCVRAWKYPDQANWPANIRPYFRVFKGDKSFQAWVIGGMMPQEDSFTKISEFLLPGGRWFCEDDLFAVILPTDAANALNASVGDSVEVMGLRLNVIGIIDSEKLDAIEDLDGRPIGPIDQFVAVKEVATKIAVVSFHRILIVPYKLANSVLSAPPYSIAVKTEEKPEYFHKVAENLIVGMRGFAEVFVGYEGKVWDYKRGLAFSLQGWQLIPVPFAIASFIVLVVMVGAVYERIREISILSAVGLAPSQVGGMFLAEAAVYAIISAVIGYLAGIVGTNILVVTGSLPEGFIPSFASMYIILVIALCLAVTMGSTAYPVRMASRATTPSLERRWKITSRPKGDEWFISLPFTSSIVEAMGIMAFMNEYFQANKVEHSGASFIVRESTLVTKDGNIYLDASVVLPPYDAHIRQSVQIVSTPLREDRVSFGIRIKRETGMRDPWIRSNYVFANAIRSQLLLWRALTPSNREEYIRIGKTTITSLS
jgi:hypothetical protein